MHMVSVGLLDATREHLQLHLRAQVWPFIAGVEPIVKLNLWVLDLQVINRIDMYKTQMQCSV